MAINEIIKVVKLDTLNMKKKIDIHSRTYDSDIERELMNKLEEMGVLKRVEEYDYSVMKEGTIIIDFIED